MTSYLAIVATDALYLVTDSKFTSYTNGVPSNPGNCTKTIINQPDNQVTCVFWSCGDRYASDSIIKEWNNFISGYRTIWRTSPKSSLCPLPDFRFGIDCPVNHTLYGDTTINLVMFEGGITHFYQLNFDKGFQLSMNDILKPIKQNTNVTLVFPEYKCSGIPAYIAPNKIHRILEDRYTRKSKKRIKDLDTSCVQINNNFINYAKTQNTHGYSNIGGNLDRTHVYFDKTGTIVVNQKIIATLP